MVTGHGKTVRIADDTGDGGDAASFSRRSKAPGPSTNAVTETP